ncbi:MAG: response regulator [Oscillospiraceae bacterium]|nr:response regulator [Oscillospiraceae bacterium]
MIKLLLADDEPLVLIGLQSMLRWEDYDIEICATARNGSQALQLIEEHHPDIVITDIKMPIKTGLEVIQECRELYGDSPVFIMLTSYEEFSFAKEALHYGATDYLVKLELSPQSLSTAVTRAVARVTELQKTTVSQSAFPSERTNLQSFRDKFFIRLYNNLFDSPEQFLLQKAELGLDFSAPQYAVAYCEIGGINTLSMNAEKLMKLYFSTIQMVKETAEKYLPCYVTSLDMRHFNILFCLNANNPDAAALEPIATALNKAVTIVHGYFSVQLFCCVSGFAFSVDDIAGAFQNARRNFSSCNSVTPVVFLSKEDDCANGSSVFNMSLFKADLNRAFDELDADILYATITEIAQCFTGHSNRHVQAMDAASSLLYMTISLLPDGEKNAEQIFSADSDSYRGLYKLKTAEGCVKWMLHLRDGLCEILQSRRQSYKERVVASVQEYIRSNLNKKLSLNEVAAVFNFSPSYLSQLFAQYSAEGFVEYITEARIATAKVMMTDTDKKVYEIAEELGFESAFYFSKVFKKVTGQSPREYTQSRKS